MISDADLDEIERKWNGICDDNNVFAELLEMARTLLKTLEQARNRRKLDDAIDKVLEGFEKRVFVRNIEGDGQPDWAIRLLPYFQALAILQNARRLN